MAERLEEKCKHPEVILVTHTVSHPFYGTGKCLTCNESVLIDTDYESKEKNVYIKKKE